MTLMFASDLDRTLIYSSNSMGKIKDEEGFVDLAVAEFYEGKPLSFMTLGSLEALTDIAERGHFVPTTTRSQEQFERVTLVNRIWRNVTQPKYAIVCNGGKILVDGKEDLQWKETLNDALLRESAPFSTMDAYFSKFSNASWCIKYRHVDRQFIYFVLDRAKLSDYRLESLNDYANENGWKTSLQGRKLYFVPNPLTKGAAVSEIASRVSANILATAGDSLLDVSMFAEADIAMRPAHGELHDEKFMTSRLIVTQRSGVRAGEEISQHVRNHLALV